MPNEFSDAGYELVKKKRLREKPEQGINIPGTNDKSPQAKDRIAIDQDDETWRSPAWRSIAHNEPIKKA